MEGDSVVGVAFGTGHYVNAHCRIGGDIQRNGAARAGDAHLIILDDAGKPCDPIVIHAVALRQVEFFADGQLVRGGRFPGARPAAVIGLPPRREVHAQAEGFRVARAFRGDVRGDGLGRTGASRHPGGDQHVVVLALLHQAVNGIAVFGDARIERENLSREFEYKTAPVFVFVIVRVGTPIADDR